MTLFYILKLSFPNGEKPNRIRITGLAAGVVYIYQMQLFLFKVTVHRLPQPVSGGVLQGSIWGPMLFPTNMLINPSFNVTQTIPSCFSHSNLVNPSTQPAFCFVWHKLGDGLYRNSFGQMSPDAFICPRPHQQLHGVMFLSLGIQIQFQLLLFMDNFTGINLLLSLLGKTQSFPPHRIQHEVCVSLSNMVFEPHSVSAAAPERRPSRPRWLRAEIRPNLISISITQISERIKLSCASRV